MTQRKPVIPQTDAAKDIAAMAAKKSKRGAHLASLTEHARPASGMKASGMPASGMEAAGDGWGGPAKGSHDHRPSDPDDLIPGPHEPSSASLMRKLNKAERSELMEAVLFDLALDDEQMGATRVNAAARLHAIHNGQPVAMTIHGDMDDIDRLSDADARAEAKRLLDQVAEARTTPEPRGLPH